MKVKIFKLVLIIFYLINSSYAANKIELEGMAVFRIDREVYLGADLKGFILDIFKYSCLFKEPLLLKRIGIQSYSLKALARKKINKKLLKKFNKTILKIILLKKVQSYVIEKDYNVSDKRISKILKLNLKRCKGYKMFHNNSALRSLIVAEIFFKERFTLKLKKMAHDKVKISNNAINLFFDSITKRMNHNVFY